MRRLLLLRHAKSSWQKEGLDDFDRPLNKRGRGAAPTTARYIADNGLSPDVILCSTALRTRETLALVLPQITGETSIHLEDDLYLASGKALLNRVSRLDPACDCAMIIAHNPGLQDLALSLAADGDTDGLRRLREKFPTAALAHIGFDTGDWASVGANEGKLIDYVTPRALATEAAG